MNKKKELIDLGINNKSQSFSYYNHLKDIGFEYTEKECTPLNKKSKCDAFTWAKDFYPYVFGMPCKFFDEGTVLDKSFAGDIINDGVEVFVIHIRYEKETWDYYINKSNFNLEGFKFVSNNDPTEGEIVFNEGQTNVNGLIVPTKRIWYDLNDKLLATDILIQNE